MFTGLVADIGRVGEVQRKQGGVALHVSSALLTKDHVCVGDSVAINGVCLTVTGGGVENQKSCWFDVMAETLRCTNLGLLQEDMKVNLELALPADGRFGGHIVQGHVDCVARISAVAEDEGFRNIRFDLPLKWQRYVVEKGSITVNGISLTVSALHGDGFVVSLIPETLARTTLGSAQVGDQVNIEVDLLAKYIERLLPV